jgi:hypothetical protein
VGWSSPCWRPARRSCLRNGSTAAERYLHTQAGISGRLVGALTGARIIAAAGATDWEIQRVLALLGSHQELLIRSPLYRDLVGRWQGEPEPTRAADGASGRDGARVHSAALY